MKKQRLLIGIVLIALIIGGVAIVNHYKEIEKINKSDATRIEKSISEKNLKKPLT